MWDFHAENGFQVVVPLFSSPPPSSRLPFLAPPKLLRGLEGPRANAKSGAHYMDCVREVWDMPPGNFEIYMP